MVDRYIQIAFDLIRGVADHAFLGPKSEAAVAAAESSLGCSFPPSYRTFLRELGCGGFYGFEAYGLVSEGGSVQGVPDAVWMTKKARADLGLPESLVVIAADGMGGLYVLDTDCQGSDYECPVRVWETGPGLTEYVADSFGEFLLNNVGIELEEHSQLNE